MERRGRAYSVLVAVKSSIIESTIRITDAERQRWIIRIGGKIIDEIQIVGPEIYTSEWCSCWYSKTGGTAASQRSVEVWGDGQGAGKCVVETSDCNGGPDYVDSVVGLVLWVRGLA